MATCMKVLAATNSFVIDTIDPEVVTIADDQSGIAFDGANTVTYTLTFSEAVQSVTEGDLTVMVLRVTQLLTRGHRHSDCDCDGC